MSSLRCRLGRQPSKPRHWGDFMNFNWGHKSVMVQSLLCAFLRKVEEVLFNGRDKCGTWRLQSKHPLLLSTCTHLHPLDNVDFAAYESLHVGSLNSPFCQSANLPAVVVEGRVPPPANLSNDSKETSTTGKQTQKQQRRPWTQSSLSLSFHTCER
ncbi:hypothetical protein F2P81_016343 [Scophthalmus maximus]|uniref:Uncharacterized protein n=1 Tax=Scophthalmus maximus TaxID=52904 RepID=A0A6A4SHU4_SCOMX|nr:hypothetical protein F2P81_016343 [Scophthalmus maximus]